MGKMIKFDDVKYVREKLKNGEFVISNRNIYDMSLGGNLHILYRDCYPKSVYDRNVPGENKFNHVLPCGYLWGNTLSGFCCIEFIDNKNILIKVSQLVMEEFLDL
ncbi:MAG: hypothetical protein KKF48_01320 [Nanoarchaeota archaeon]|nr:hypothetical protein [Nanoarchaeota archaeon]MBU1027662.1 hypothetical protein [Nanoarchaeota archaeon]